MEKRIDLELRRRNPSEIKELNLDNCRSTCVVGLTDEYTNLQILSLNNVGLTTLKGFPTLPQLWKLELSDNRISSGLNFLHGCKRLAHLNLSNNKIKDLETLKPLEQFENLKNLDLYNNEVTNIDDYRSKMFALRPSLKYLDGFDKYDREAEDSDVEEDEMNGNNDSEEDSEGAEEEEEAGLSTLYNNLEEESLGSSLYEGTEESEDDDDDDDDEAVDDNDAGDENFADGVNLTDTKSKESKPRGMPEESTRGKKRKHEDEDEN